MQLSTVLTALLAAAVGTPVAFAAPIPTDLVSLWERRLAAAAVRPSIRLSRAATAALTEDPSLSAVVIDNRHYTPSGAVAPSTVLATPRPISTTFLMSLARAGRPVRVPMRVAEVHGQIGIVIVGDEAKTATEAAASDAKPARSTGPVETSETAIPVPETVMMEAHPEQMAHAAAVDMPPCPFATQLRRDYYDMVVISLVAVFLFIIVVVELVDAGERRDHNDALMGSIRLASDAVTEKRPLSVQASPVVLTSATTETDAP